MVRAFRRVFWLAAIPLAAAIVATALFLMQHGFGGGHGRFDQALGILALPGILVVEHLPLSESIPDFILVILLPAVFNIVLWIGLALILRSLLRGRLTI
jgi:hypothetical protein